MKETTQNKNEQVKPWFKLRGVEYSTDFNFFLENQIVIGRSNGNNINYFSRLEKQKFFSEKEVGFYGQELKTAPKKEKCKEIHKKLLAGEYGVGEFID